MVFFIDGFNLYHSIDTNKIYHKYKWLNLSKFAECFIKPSDQINKIYYFTALAQWDQSKVIKHKILIKALEIQGVKVIYGKFKMRDKKCPHCNRIFQKPEEKQTDVNIAINLFKGAVQNDYDTAIIISGDSDLIPSIEAIKTIFPVKKFGVVIPIGRSDQGSQFTYNDFTQRLEDNRINNYFKFYNTERFHQSLDYKTPDEIYYGYFKYEGIKKAS